MEPIFVDGFLFIWASMVNFFVGTKGKTGKFKDGVHTEQRPSECVVQIKINLSISIIMVSGKTKPYVMLKGLSALKATL